MNNTIKELFERKSIRQYLDKDISVEDKHLIFQAAINAPTAGNMQLYSIIDVTEQNIKEQLAILCDNQPFIKEGKMVLLFLADYTRWVDCFNSLNIDIRDIDKGDMLLAMEDALIAAQNAVVAAESLGIGSCYIGDIMENCEKIVELFNLPVHCYPACMVVFGYPTDIQLKRNKPKRLDNKYVIFENKYQRLNSEELKAAFIERTSSKGYQEWMEQFAQRKHNSEFSYEMQRGAKFYLDRFTRKG